MSILSRSAAVGEDLRAFTRAYVEAWNACDTDAMAELVTEDVIWADPALPLPQKGSPSSRSSCA